MYELEYCLYIVENQISDRGDQMKEPSLNIEEKTNLKVGSQWQRHEGTTKTKMNIKQKLQKKGTDGKKPEKNTRKITPRSQHPSLSFWLNHCYRMLGEKGHQKYVLRFSQEHSLSLSDILFISLRIINYF